MNPNSTFERQKTKAPVFRMLKCLLTLVLHLFAAFTCRHSSHQTDLNSGNIPFAPLYVTFPFHITIFTDRILQGRKIIVPRVRFKQQNSGDILRRLNNMNGNCISIVSSMKLPLIRNLLTVNNINNKLIEGVQIPFIADKSFTKD